MANVDQTLDASGLNCPLPLLKTKKALSALDVGQTLCVTCTDPGSMKDFIAFCKQTGHELLESSEADGSFSFLILKR